MRTAALALLLSGCCCDPSQADPPAPPPPRAAPALDTQAEAGVELAMKNGWITAINYEHGFAEASATVTPAFRALSFELRQATAANVAAAGKRRKDKATFTVNLVDTEGRGVGTYSSVLARLVE